IKRFDTNYKMNPPLRSEDDRQAVVGAVIDGTICAIATDHAPHTRTAKLVEFDSAPFGIVGLETAFSVSYTELVKRNGMPLKDYVARLTTGPASVLRMKSYGLAAGNPADIVVFDPESKYTVDSSTFRSMARNTPFDGMEVTGRVERTFVDGRQVYSI
ncbi:MAG: amidohydrolase family protein, partial [Victivallaceae bacterium]|nr:amidohydrolase family protein [Victivallaceae bacterium]